MNSMAVAASVLLLAKCTLHELAARVRHAAHLGDAAVEEQRLVSRVVVAYEAALPGALGAVTEERTRMLARAALGEVVDHGAHILERAAGVGPEIGAMRLACAGCQHRHRRLVVVQHRQAQQVGLHGVDQRLQAHTAHTHPGRQRRARDGQAGALEDGFLAIQRQMVRVLGDEHMGEQAGGRQALVDDIRRHRCLGQCAALRAGPLAAHMAFQGKANELSVSPGCSLT